MKYLSHQLLKIKDSLLRYKVRNKNTINMVYKIWEKMMNKDH